MTLRRHLITEMDEELRAWASGVLQREHLGEPRNSLGALHKLIGARGWVAELHLLASGEIEAVVGVLFSDDGLTRAVDELGAVRADSAGKAVGALSCAYALALKAKYVPQAVGA